VTQIPVQPESITVLEEAAEMLCSRQSLETVLYRPLHDAPMPSLALMEELLSRLRVVLFPGFFGHSKVHPESMRYHVQANLDSIYRLLAEQIHRGGCFACAESPDACDLCGPKSHECALAFIARLPHIRRMLSKDAKAAYEGDPAATSIGETIFCYPSMTVMTYHRIAHELYKLKVPIIPRIISEMAHSLTGIDINPGASIGEEFFIDHGTGVVFGETCVIGNNCRLYQGVTLGALSFPKDNNGMLVKGIARHPVLEDNVIVYSGSTILGRITIGRGSTIGGNMWVTGDVAPGSTVLMRSEKW
jgi:serine O-acetyltransferase